MQIHASSNLLIFDKMAETTLTGRLDARDAANWLVDEHISIPLLRDRISDLGRGDNAANAITSKNTLQAIKTLKEFLKSDDYRISLRIEGERSQGTTYKTVRDELYDCIDDILKGKRANESTKDAVSGMALDIILSGPESESKRMSRLVGSLYMFDNHYRTANEIFLDVFSQGGIDVRAKSIDVFKQIVSENKSRNQTQIKSRMKDTITGSRTDLYTEFERYLTGVR